MLQKFWKVLKYIILGIIALVLVLGVFVTGKLTIGRDKCQLVPRNTVLSDDTAYQDRHALFPLRTITVNGLNYAYIEAGEGPLVILVHGFPDSGARTWEEVMQKLAAQGFHAVAIFNRGYYPTDMPADGDYSVASMGNDVVALAKALGEEQAMIIGEDWGASIAYAAANANPNTITKIVTLSIPHPSTIVPKFVNFRCFPHFLVLQFGPLSEWYARRNNFAYLEYLYHYWSPSWSVPKSQIEEVRDNFSKPGRLAAAISYYHWAFTDTLNAERTQFYKQKTSVPTMMFVGEEDAAHKIGLFHKAEDGFSGPFEMVLVPRAGHFLHREQPDIFVEKAIEFLKK